MVRLVTVLASIQSGKTLLARLLSCHIAGRAPGPTLILQDNDQNARDFNLTALRPLWDNCPSVKERLVPEMDRSSTIQFQGMTAWVLGATQREEPPTARVCATSSATSAGCGRRVTWARRRRE